jgi:DNA-binding response OmpR family regulator/signal transduction histidine kinase/CHASE3 domain sensor protein
MILNSAQAFRSPRSLTRSYRASLAGLVFVVALLLALITLPPLANGRAEMLRGRLDADVQGFASALIASENSLQEMQAAARGFLLTEAPAFLEQYAAARDGLPSRLQDLEQLAPRVDPALAEPVAELVQVVDRWQRERVDRQIALVQQGQREAALAEVASGQSQGLFDSLRSRINDLQEQAQAEQAALVQDISGARSLQVGLTSGLGALGLLAVGFVIVAFRSVVVLMRDLQVERERTAELAQQARAERQRLQTLFDHSPEGLVFAEAPAGQLSLLNPAAAALLGPILPDQPLREQPWTRRVFRVGGEPFPPDDLPLVRTVEQGKASRTVELTIEQPDGQRVPVLLTSVPLVADDGSVRGAVAVFQDLRSLREVERLKSDFVALVSHELRTPLTAIQGSVQGLLLAGAEADPSRTRAFLQIIAEQSERLEELIDNLLSLSQVEAGALRLRRALVQPQPLIAGVLRQMRDRLSDLRVQSDLAPHLPLVSADARRIEQVLFNLLDNARKFSPPGGLITVSAQQSGASVTICVRDQGPGVPPGERERVFERFYQLEQPATRNVGGSGLGLAICKAIVEAHDGSISVDEAPGGGARFCFTLPAMPCDERPSAAAAPALQRSSNGKTHVLVVDDDPALRRLLETSLPEAGYSVQAVVEAQGALEAVSRHAPDVILLDLMLPGVDGFELCRQLREWTNVPIIMLTALASEKDVVLGLQLGADDYLTKPFRSAELVARIEAVLRRAQPAVEAGAPAVIQIGGLTLDLAERRVLVDGAPVELTPLEYQILTFLAKHPGQVLTHSQILQAVWGESYGGENHYLWVHIAHLRQKLEADSKQPRYILTERGVGYRLAKE